MTQTKKQIDSITHYLKESKNIFFFTGAGISTDSGIPDFRGPDGVWKRRQPVYYQDFLSFERSRIEYWDYKLEWWENNRDAKPNSVHNAIYELEKAGKILIVVTQNIDGLHRLAGTSEENIVELHGTNWQIECQTCFKRDEPAVHFAYFKTTQKAPICTCGGYLKPATISFGQSLRSKDIIKAEKATHKADCAIALGSTLSVYPAATFPVHVAQRGMPYIVINRGQTDHDALPETTMKVDAPLGEVFPQAVKCALQ